MADKMLRLTYDADGAGRQCGKAIIANDEKALHNISAKIDLGHEIVNEWVVANGGKRISGGGDEGSFKLPIEATEKVEELRKKYFKSTGLTISVGIGKDLSEAGRSLLYAKATGKDKVVWYSSQVEYGIKQTQKKVKNGTASQEEIKLADAYLEKAEVMGKICELHKKEQHKKHVHALHKHEEGFHDPKTNEGSEDPCPYCADSEDNRTDDCAYCQDLDAEENADGTAGMHECPACKEYDNVESQGAASNIDDCPYCQTENISEIQAHPNMEEGMPAEQGAEDHHRCNCPNCPQNDQTGLAVEDAGAQRPDECPECDKMYSEAVENQPGQTGQEDPNMQGHETAEEVLDLLDQEPGSGAKTPTQEAKQIDNTELPQGDQMKEGTSVPENFGQAQKGDVSDSEQQLAQGGAPADGSPQEDAPDMSAVLQSGLDDHANEQKKQQVLDMVAQTLQGFKANKASLEASKEQNQGLYNSCIQMLKSMIELCKLMGLEPKMPTQAPNDPGAVAEATQAGAPDAPKQAAPAEGAAEDPKAQAG
jgi:hypothetical protein